MDVHDRDVWLVLMPLIGFLMIWGFWHEIRKEGREPTKAGQRIGNRFALVFGFVWTGLVSYMCFQSAIILPNRLDSGQFETSEGPITRYVLQPWKGYGSEIFSVGATRFDRFDYDVRSKDGAITRPGCLAEGKWARVSHIGLTLLRIEVEVDPSSPNPKCRKAN